MNLDQAIANLATLHRQSRLTPEQHEAIKDSLKSLNNLAFPEKNESSNISPDVAFNNFGALFTRANLTIDEYEALKESFSILNALILSKKS